MSEIPEDVKIAAIDIALKGKGEFITITDLANAILAERKRCVEAARNYPPLVADGNSLRAANQVDIAKAIEAGQ